MAFKRKIMKRKVNKKRTYRKRKVMRLTRSVVPASMNYKRSFWLQTWVPSTVSTSDFWKFFAITLSSIPNVTELTGLFDQYKINAYKLTFYPKYSEFAGNDQTTSTTNIGQTFMSICYDNRRTVSSTGTYSSSTFNSFCEQGKVKLYKKLNRPMSIYIKPTIEGKFINGTSANMWTGPQWLPTSSSTISHWGPQVFVHDNNFSAAALGRQSFDIFCTVYLQVKNAK